MLNALQEAASSVTAAMNNAGGLFEDGRTGVGVVGVGGGDFGQFRSVPVFGIHIKYRSWNMLMSYSKQFYMLVSRTGRAILGHQVLCPLTTPTSRKMLQSIADAKSLFSEKL